MQKGFTKLTLGLFGAALLSSSAFAVGPTLKRLPDVYITGNTKDAGVQDIGDGASAATDIYRFTDAFVLSDYVEYPGTISAVQWQFRELDESLAPLTGGAKTITINGGFGEDTMPDYTSITTSGGTVGAAGALDFVNAALTPDVTADGTAPTGGVDVSTIELYVADGLVDGEVDVATFDVYTTNDDNVAAFDNASVPSSIYTAVTCITDFENWITETAVDNGAPVATMSPSLVANKLDDGGGLDFPAAGANTPAVTVSTLAGTPAGSFFQYGTWKSLRRDLTDPNNGNALVGGVPVQAGNIYMARWTISSDGLTTAAGRSASVQTPNVRLRMGETSNLGNGNVSHEFPENGLNAIIGDDQVVRTYYYVKGDYTDAGATASLEMGLFFDLLDLYAPDSGANGSNTLAGAFTPNGQRNYGLTLSSVEVFSLDRDDLSGAVVEFNEGASIVSVAAGETAPTDTNRTDFTATSWGFRENQDPGNRVGTVESASALTFNVVQTGTTASTDAYFVVVDTNDYAVANDEEVVTVSNDRLVIIDAYVSTNVAGTAADNKLPGRGSVSGIRLGMQTDVYAPVGIPTVRPALNFDNNPVGAFYDSIPVVQGRAGYLEFSASNAVPKVEGDFILGTPYALGTASKTVSYIFEPLAVDVPSGPALSFRPTFEIYSFPIVSRADAEAFETLSGTPAEDVSSAFNAGQVNVNRVVITSYDLPVDPDSTCP